MRMVIDKAGRVVVPLAIRRELRLEPGVALEATVEDGRLVATPVSGKIGLAQENGRLVAVAPESDIVLGHDELLDLIGKDREWPRPR